MKQDETFAVTEEFQAKLLSFMLHNEDYREVVSLNLKPELFGNKALQWFFLKLAEKQLTPVLLQEELISAAKGKTIKEDEVSKYVGLYEVIKQRPVPAEEDYVREKLGTFIKTQSVKKSIIESLPLIQEERWEEIVENITNATQVGLNFNDVGTNYFAELQERIVRRSQTNHYRRIPFGIPEMDAITYGGLKNSQTGIVVGGTGRGKSIFLQWLSRVAVLLGNKVLYVTMELSEDEIADRFDSMFSMVKPQELNEYQQNVLTEVGKLATTYGSSLIIKHYPTDTCTVGTIKALLKQLSTIGIVPDLLVIDYLDLMAPHRSYHNKVDEQDAVVKAVVGMGQEYDISIWTAAQLNRSGLVMDTPDESAMAGYIGRQFIAAMVLWLAQTKEEKEDELMRIVVSKNRNGLSGKTVKLTTDYSYMTFFREMKSIENNIGAATDGTGLGDSPVVID